MDFPKIMTTLEEIGYDRWVTACPGQIEDRSDRERMDVNRKYLQELGILSPETLRIPRCMDVLESMQRGIPKVITVKYSKFIGLPVGAGFPCPYGLPFYELFFFTFHALRITPKR